jgi:hypothetical protein
MHSSLEKERERERERERNLQGPIYREANEV